MQSQFSKFLQPTPAGAIADRALKVVQALFAVVGILALLTALTVEFLADPDGLSVLGRYTVAIGDRDTEQATEPDKKTIHAVASQAWKDPVAEFDRYECWVEDGESICSGGQVLTRTVCQGYRLALGEIDSGNEPYPELRPMFNVCKSHGGG